MRYNYASADCGARVIGASKEASSTSAILNNNRDSYMLAPCSTTSRHTIIELCQQIRVDSIAVSNFEYFSSTFKKCRLSIPAKKNDPWEVVGEWVARPGRGEQTFKLQTATPNFTKFIRVDFDGHFGSSYYCPITSVKVFGKTMMEEFVEEDGKEEVSNQGALITVPTLLPLATVMECERQCVAATAVTTSTDRSSENVFKAINDRLNRLERTRLESEEVRAQLDGLARIIVNLVGREHRLYAGHKQLPSTVMASEPVTRCEFYSVVFLLFLFFLSFWYFRGRTDRQSKTIVSDRRVSINPTQDLGLHPPHSPFPLDVPNSDYLGMARTPVDSVERGQSPSPGTPSRRRSSIKQ